MNKLETPRIDETNFEEVFKTYFGPLVNYVNGYLKDWESSREIVQGSFLRIWENRANITITTSVKSYLYSAVRNRMIDYVRSNKKEIEYKKQLSEESAMSSGELDTFLIREEIVKSLDKMKPKMQKIFRLSKLEGLTYNEIASYLNISKRTVEDNMAKALVFLRGELQKNPEIFSD